MKNKTLQWITVTGFCGFLAVMAALYLFAPKMEFSQLEKRYLEDAPVLTTKSLTSGQFGEDMESYMADHIPGRDFFVGLNAYVDLLTFCACDRCRQAVPSQGTRPGCCNCYGPL